MHGNTWIAFGFDLTKGRSFSIYCRSGECLILLRTVLRGDALPELQGNLPLAYILGSVPGSR